MEMPKMCTNLIEEDHFFNPIRKHVHKLKWKHVKIKHKNYKKKWTYHVGRHN